MEKDVLPIIKSCIEKKKKNACQIPTHPYHCPFKIAEQDSTLIGTTHGHANI